jgi:hypothetical protein
MHVAMEKQNHMAFESENHLVNTLVEIMDGGKTPWGGLQTLTEWDYRTGITDVLARTEHGEVIA